jgi:hypothetical protein
LINQTERGKLRPIGRGLFPGILTILLAIFAFVLPPYASRLPVGWGVGGLPRIRTLEKLVNGLLLLLVGLVGAIIFSRGLEFSFAGLHISMTRLSNPFYLILFLLTMKLILTRFSLHNFESPENSSTIDRNFYLFLAIFSCMLSFGPKIYYITHDFGTGPYMFFYKNIVLFKGIRVPERFGILVMLGLSILAGYGAVKVLDLLKKNAKVIVSCFVIVFLVYEFICVPFPVEKIPREPAEVYKWLGSLKEECAILEIPLNRLQMNKYYMYWSIFHWKTLGNGSSGFNPPVFNQLRKIARDMVSLPNQEFIQYVKTHIPVKYLIFHLARLSEPEKEEILMNVSRFPEDLKWVRTFGKDCHVYEVIY